MLELNWVNTNDRLPEGGHNVLLLKKDGNVAEGHYDKQSNLWCQYRWSCMVPPENVVSWSELPDMTEGGKNGLIFDFGSAIRMVKSGCKVKRKGWNGKNQHIELATGISYVAADGGCVNCNHNAIGNKAIAFVGTSGVQIGWLASQADMLAEDWIFAD